MADHAVCSRLMQFRAGPNEFIFHACQRHRARLENDDVDLFFALVKDPVIDLPSQEDEQDYECYFCAGEDGP